MKLKVGDRVKGLIDLTARGLVVRIVESNDGAPYRVVWLRGKISTIYGSPEESGQNDSTIALDEDPMERFVRRRGKCV